MSDQNLPTPVKRGRGQPPYEVKEGEPQLVRIMAANGVPHEDIAMCLKISLKTMKKHFAEELKNGRALIRARMGVSAVQKALAGDNEMLKFWLRTHGGPEWRPPTQVELAGANGEPLQPPTLVIGFMKPKADIECGDDGGSTP